MILQKYRIDIILDQIVIIFERFIYKLLNF